MKTGTVPASGRVSTQCCRLRRLLRLYRRLISEAAFFRAIMLIMNIKNFLIFLGFLAAIFLILMQSDQLEEFLRLIQTLNIWILLLVLPTQFLSYYANAKFFQSLLRIFGYPVSTRLLFKASLAMTFVSQALPSAGVSGASFFAHVLRDEVPPGKSAVAQVMRYAFTYLATLLILIAGFLLLFMGGGVGKISVRLTLLVQLGIIIAGIVGIVIFAASRSRIEALALKLAWGMNFVGKFLKKAKIITAKQIRKFLDEFYEGFSALTETKGSLRMPFSHAFVLTLAEIMTVMVVAAAMGIWINPGVVIAAYTIANIASLAAPITNGIGVYEAAMVATFTALGVPLGASVSIVLVYRILNFLLLMPLGLHYYRKLLK